MALLASLLTPFALSVNGCFTLMALMATSANDPHARIVPAGDAIYLETGQVIVLHLRDGSSVQGRFAGRSLLAPGPYREIFATRFARGGWMPLALGETLTVETGDGRRMTGPFAGYAIRSLVLRTAADSDGVRLPYETTRAVHRAGGSVVSLDSLLAADVRGELPSAEAIAMMPSSGEGGISEKRGTARRIPLDDVQRVTVGAGARKASGLIVFGMILDVALFIVIRDASSQPSGPSCDAQLPSGWPLGTRFTERPFDRVLGRFVDEENVAWPDSLIAPARTRNAPEHDLAPTREGTAISR